MATVFTDIRQYFKTFLSYVGKRLYLLLGMSLMAGLLDGLGITMVFPLLQIINDPEKSDVNGQGSELYDMLEYLNIPTEVVPMLIFIAIIFVLKALALLGSKGYQASLTAFLTRRITKQLLSKYLGMSYPYYTSRNTGHFINVMNGQILNFIISFKTFNTYLSQIITTTIYFAFAFYMSWQFSLMIAGVGLFIAFLMKSLSRKVKNNSIEFSEQTSIINQLAVQLLTGFKYLVATAGYKSLEKQINAKIDRLADLRFKMDFIRAITAVVREPIVIISIIVVFAINVVVLGQNTSSILVAIILLQRSMNQIISLQNVWQNMMANIGGTEMTTSEFDRLAKNQEPVGALKIESINDKIELKNVSFKYDNAETYALKNVSLSIPKNKTVAFVGASGAGKSTLIDLLTGILVPTEGKLLYNNLDLNDIDKLSLRRKIGYITQDVMMFDDSVANNISLKLSEDSRDIERIQEAAVKAHCHEFIQELPEGYFTQIGDRGVRLSGGQKQRMSIARELYKEPELLLLDEATSALDTESENHIRRSIDDLKGKLTVVIIAHRLSTIKNADYIFVLKDGELKEQGSFQELNTEGKLFKKMVELQII